MAFLDCFSEEMNLTYSVYPKLTTLDADDEPIEGFATTASLTGIQCAYWTGSAAERLMEERYKTQASGIIVSDIQTVQDGAKIVLNNGIVVYCIHADDVMYQGEVLTITVQADNFGTV